MFCMINTTKSGVAATLKAFDKDGNELQVLGVNFDLPDEMSSESAAICYAKPGFDAIRACLK